MHDTFRSGYVAIIGRPNVGKSTLMNKIIDQKIAIVTDRPQTTRDRIRTVYTDERCQIVFLDTPGVLKPRRLLDDHLVSAARSAAAEADIILWLVEAGTYIGTGDAMVLDILKNVRKPVFLIINKTDKNSPGQILESIDFYRRQMDFEHIIPISALKGDNVDDLINTMYSCLKEGPKFFDDDTVTDSTQRQIAAELVREKMLTHLKEEVPHGVVIHIESMKERRDGIWDIHAVIYCEKESHKAIIVGKGGAMIKKIGQAARFEIERMLEGRANLRLWVKVKKDWRDDKNALKKFGYGDV